MKRILIAVALLCIVLNGCSLFSGDVRDPVLFYYRRADYLMGQSDGAIAAEERDGAGHITDINYLLRLYLTGPHNEELTSPFPADVQLNSVRIGQGKVNVALTGTPDSLPEAQQMLACACLTLTCLEITGEEAVAIFWGEEVFNMDRSCLTLYDSCNATTE